jgi:hypothetical protein
VQVGKSEDCEFFGIAFSLFPSPLQVTLKQAAAVVGRINAKTRRPEDRPRHVRGPSDRNLVHHSSRSGDSDTWLLATRITQKGFQFFPNVQKHIRTVALARWCARSSTTWPRGLGSVRSQPEAAIRQTPKICHRVNQDEDRPEYVRQQKTHRHFRPFNSYGCRIVVFRIDVPIGTVVVRR